MPAPRLSQRKPRPQICRKSHSGLMNPRSAAHEAWAQIQVSRAQINQKALRHLEHKVLRLGRNWGGVALPDITRGPRPWPAPSAPAGSAQAGWQAGILPRPGQRKVAVYFSTQSLFSFHMKPGGQPCSQNSHPLSSRLGKIIFVS